eukprot:4967571-Prymnesium_polylepis.2
MENRYIRNLSILLLQIGRVHEPHKKCYIGTISASWRSSLSTQRCVRAPLVESSTLRSSHCTASPDS